MVMGRCGEGVRNVKGSGPQVREGAGGLMVNPWREHIKLTCVSRRVLLGEETLEGKEIHSFYVFLQRRIRGVGWYWGKPNCSSEESGPRGLEA